MSCLRGARLLELGAGCGLVSALCAQLGAAVTASDGEDAVLHRLRQSSALNARPFEVKKLRWGEEEPRETEHLDPVRTSPFDVILGADITYNCSQQSLTALLDLISSLACEATESLLAHGLRGHEQAAALWSSLQERWGAAARILDGPMPPWAERSLEEEDPVLIFSLKGPELTFAADGAMPDPASPVLRWINDSTKWLVSGTVFGVLLWRRDCATCWCVLGSVCAALNCKCLKFIINESRPAGARKIDPGMPSSHAQSLGFLSTYTALSLLDGTCWHGLCAAAICAGGGFGSWLRLRLGFHTWPQVAAGFGLGALSAMGWQYLYVRQVQPHLQDSLLVWGIKGSTALGSALFAAKLLYDMAKDAGDRD
ncbi:unnamed protein product [Effrenium voratum]|nr:unnamed protein product [Effrenium voratum]